MRVVRTSNIELLVIAALTSQQWPVKAQAARAMGTVATKLAANIQPDSQARLVLLLLCDLGGRTWDSKEELSESLADIVKSAPDILRVNMVVREGREEKVE